MARRLIANGSIEAKAKPRVRTNKVLFVTSNRIGDCVISSGVIREIGRQIPGAEITVACGRPPAPFFRSAPGVERVIILDKKKAAGHWLDLWRQVVGTRWDLVIDIRGSALGYLIPAPTAASSTTARWETGLPKVEMVSRLMGSPIAAGARTLPRRPGPRRGRRRHRPGSWPAALARPDHRPGPHRPPAGQELARRPLGRSWSRG